MAILDTLDIIKNLETIYDSDNSFRVLKDFERVIDELGVYVYDNWEEGELASGPQIERHWVSCTFMWDYKNMPDPAGAKRLLDYDCKVRIAKGHVLRARQIKSPNDFRPGTKKGKLDKHPVWFVEIRIPKKLIVDIFGGSQAIEKSEVEDVQLSQQANTAQIGDAGLDGGGLEGTV
jgi:hypothetical protein